MHCPIHWIVYLLKSVHFKKPVTRSSFLSKSVVIFAVFVLISAKMTTRFERNEDRVTDFLKWMDFSWHELSSWGSLKKFRCLFGQILLKMTGLWFIGTVNHISHFEKKASKFLDKVLKFRSSSQSGISGMNKVASERLDERLMGGGQTPHGTPHGTPWYF